MACTEQDPGVACQHSCEAGRRDAPSTATSSLLLWGLRRSSVLSVLLLCALLQDLARSFQADPLVCSVILFFITQTLHSCKTTLPLWRRQWSLSLKQGRTASYLPGNKFCVPLIHRFCLFMCLYCHLRKLFFLGKFKFQLPLTLHYP